MKDNQTTQSTNINYVVSFSLITVFLRKYSDASSTEVGTLLMILPFLAVFTKPFFCALADRHRRYRLYFILALIFTLIGFGSYTFLPFFPEFIAAHGRMAWWILVFFTVIGYLAYGVVWSLGDAYAANVAHRTGESFGLIRLWGTVGWGVSGAIVGAVSPYVNLPEMVLGFIIFVVTHIFEIILLTWWPNSKDFEMGDALPSHGGDEPSPIETESNLSKVIKEKVLAVQNHHSTILSLDSAKEQNDISMTRGAELISASIKNGLVNIQRTPSNALEIITKLRFAAGDIGSEAGQIESSIGELVRRGAHLDAQKLEKLQELERKRISQLQTTIFKMVSVKHKSIIKYLLIFIALGTVYNVHWSYFFLHLDRLALEGKGGDFSTLVGMCLVAQAVGETFCFIIAPWVVRKLGRDGAISLNAIAYAVRYLGNGIGIPMISPYVAVLTESLQGINYGIFYYLITDTALHYALKVDEVIPELIDQGLIDQNSDLNAVKTSLRATMQGVFSGAFDGLGFGIGSLIAGIVLENHSYEELWCYTGVAAFIIFILHGLYEIFNRIVRAKFTESKEILHYGAGFDPNSIVIGQPRN